MLHQVPEEIISSLKVNHHVNVKYFSHVSGGCINNGRKLTASEGNYFLKWNSSVKFPGMFAAETKGLQLLKSTNTIHIPGIVCFETLSDHQYILMEFVDSKPKSPLFWDNFGMQLASLHQYTSTHFGLDHDNYIGSLKQSNNKKENWFDLFIEERLLFQLKLAEKNKLADQSFQKAFDLLYKKLPDLLPHEKPALVHGDLWSGNVITNSHGAPCLIDPAVHYGHREADLAMTQLFGGFDINYLKAYHEVYPLEQGFHERIDIYNLYPLLAHLNLFGSGYRSQIQSILKRLV